MGIHAKITACAVKMAGAIPVTKSYDMDGNLHLVVCDDEAKGPKSYSMTGSFERQVREMVFDRSFKAEIAAAGIACCSY